jgi:hypothetical protein
MTTSPSGFCRSDPTQGAHDFAQHLLTKAAERLRRGDYYCHRLGVHLSWVADLGGWWDETDFHETRDTGFLLARLEELWQRVPRYKPISVGVSNTAMSFGFPSPRRSRCASSSGRERGGGDVPTVANLKGRENRLRFLGDNKRAPSRPAVLCLLDMLRAVPPPPQLLRDFSEQMLQTSKT